MTRNTNSSSFQIKDLIDPWCRAEVKTVVKNCSLMLKPSGVWINSAGTAWLILKIATINFLNKWAPKVTYFKHKILIFLSSEVCAIVHGEKEGSSELIFKPRGISTASQLLRLFAWSLANSLQLFMAKMCHVPTWNHVGGTGGKGLLFILSAGLCQKAVRDNHCYL